MAEVKFEEKTIEEIQKEFDKRYPHLKTELENIKKAIQEKYSNFATEVALRIIEVIFTILAVLFPSAGFLIGIPKAYFKLGEQESNSVVQPEIPEIPELIQAWRKGDLTDEEFKDLLRKKGYAEDKIQILLDGFKRDLTVEEILEAYRRGEMMEEEAETKLAELGLTEYELDLLLKLSRRLLDKSEIIALWLRNEIDDVELKERLKQHGYSEEDIEKIKQLAFYIPSVSDLIELVVKEAFDEEKVRRLGLDANVERVVEKVGKYVKAQGLSEEWLRRYWYAHWRLPSPEQGINMYFRGLINFDQLKDLLVALDYPPFWVEKLLGLAQAIPTRVDLRRFIENGLADFEYVKEQYKKQGYTDEDAERLARLAFFTATQEERNKLRKTIIEGFKTGWISEDDARQMLKDIFIQESVIDFLIQNAKLEKHQEQIEAELKVIKNRFLKGIISEDEMFKELIQLGLSAKESEFYRYTWVKEKEARHKTITKYELKEMLKHGIIDRKTFIDKLVAMGYSRDDAELLYQLEEAKLKHGR